MATGKTLKLESCMTALGSGITERSRKICALLSGRFAVNERLLEELKTMIRYDGNLYMCDKMFLEDLIDEYISRLQPCELCDVSTIQKHYDFIAAMQSVPDKYSKHCPNCGRKIYER